MRIAIEQGGKRMASDVRRIGFTGAQLHVKKWQNHDPCPAANKKDYQNEKTRRLRASS